MAARIKDSVQDQLDLISQDDPLRPGARCYSFSSSRCQHVQPVLHLRNYLLPRRMLDVSIARPTHGGPV
jgi:hypothetical protein